MRYGKERNQVLNASRSRVALLMLKDCKQINLRQGLISVNSLVILKKQWDIISTNLITIRCLWQEEQPFWKEFLVEGNHGKEIELDETQVTNDNITQEYEMETKRSFFDVLKLGQGSSTQTIMA